MDENEAKNKNVGNKIRSSSGSNQSIENQTNFCPSCGERITDGDTNFCENCGKEL
jgi:predicted amidophosphoribosyltransferase